MGCICLNRVQRNLVELVDGKVIQVAERLQTIDVADLALEYCDLDAALEPKPGLDEHVTMQDEEVLQFGIVLERQIPVGLKELRYVAVRHQSGVDVHQYEAAIDVEDEYLDRYGSTCSVKYAMNDRNSAELLGCSEPLTKNIVIPFAHLPTTQLSGYLHSSGCWRRPGWGESTGPPKAASGMSCASRIDWRGTWDRSQNGS